MKERLAKLILLLTYLNEHEEALKQYTSIEQLARCAATNAQAECEREEREAAARAGQ